MHAVSDRSKSNLRQRVYACRSWPTAPADRAKLAVRNEFLLRVLNQRNTPVVFQVEILNGPRSLRLDGLKGGLTVGGLTG